MKRSDVQERLGRFVRGDTPPSDFEPWVYASKGLEEVLGKDVVLQMISTRYSDEEEVRALRRVLAGHLRLHSNRSCLCIRLKDLDVVDMGTFQAPEPAFESDREWSHEDVFNNFKKIKKRGMPYWWLWAARCRVCGQGWLIGSEERQNDIFCMRRLEEGRLAAIVDQDQWPSEFDLYETLLRIGIENERSVRFLDPQDPGLRATIVDLARNRPGISISEIAKLLNMDLADAEEMAREAADSDGINVTFDTR